MPKKSNPILWIQQNPVPKPTDPKLWIRKQVTVLDGFYTTYPSTVLLEKRLQFPVGEGRHVLTWSDLIPKPDEEQRSVWGVPGRYKITVEVELPQTVYPKRPRKKRHK